MSLPKTYSTGGRARGLPIDGTIDYSGVASHNPVGEFPPIPVRTRLDRLSWLWELFNGDFSDLAPFTGGNQANQQKPTFIQYGQSRFTTQTNPFRIVPTTVAELLLMVPPEFDDARQSVNMYQALYKIIADQSIYGASVVLATGEPQEPLEVLEPYYWVPTYEGWWYITPLVDPEGNYTEVEVRVFTNETNTLEHYIHVFGGTYNTFIGDVIEVGETVSYPNNPLRVIPRLPCKVGMGDYKWGTSAFEDMASQVAEMNKRYSDISYALDRQAKPTMTYRIADADREDIAPEVTATGSFEDGVDELAKELSHYDDHNHLALPNAIQGMDAITWDARVDESLIYVAELKASIEAAVSIPGLFTGLAMEGALSGIALKRLMLRLYANTLQTQSATEVSVNELLALSGVPPLEWMNALNAMEEESNDVEDEEGMLRE